MKLRYIAEVRTNFPEADFWLIRKGDPERIGEPTRVFRPEDIGIRITRPDILLPNFFFYFMTNMWMNKHWCNFAAAATTRLCHIRTSDLKNLDLDIEFPVEESIPWQVDGRRTVGAHANARQYAEGEYLHLWESLDRPPTTVVPPLGPIWLPEEDPDWESPAHTQQVAGLLRRLTPYSATVCAITALEMTLPEWNILAAALPASFPNNWGPRNFPEDSHATVQFFPAAIEYMWKYLHGEIEVRAMILLEAEIERARSFLLEAATSVEQGALRGVPALVHPYPQMTIGILQDLAASYEISDLYQLLDRLHGAQFAVQGSFDPQSSSGRFAMAVTQCLEHDARLLQRWWQLCRRRLAMRDV